MMIFILIQFNLRYLEAIASAISTTASGSSRGGGSAASGLSSG